MQPYLTAALRDAAIDPATCVLRHVARTSRTIVAAYDRALAPTAVTGHQFNTLMTLALAGPLSVRALAAHVGVDPSTVPRAISPLVKDGLVAVRAGTRDRRQRNVRITPRGERRLAAAVPLWKSQQRAFVEAIGESKWKTLRRALRRLRREEHA